MILTEKCEKETVEKPGNLKRIEGKNRRRTQRKKEQILEVRYRYRLIPC